MKKLFTEKLETEAGSATASSREYNISGAIFYT